MAQYLNAVVLKHLELLEDWRDEPTATAKHRGANAIGG
jgi:hypothetical protein